LRLSEDLRAGGAFEDFRKAEHGDHAGGSDGEPDEPAFGGFHRRSAITLAACAARPLRVSSVGIENDAIGGAFRNIAHVIFDGDTQRPASALDDQFLGIQNRNSSDGGLVGVRANHRRSHVQGKSI